MLKSGKGFFAAKITACCVLGIAETETKDLLINKTKIILMPDPKSGAFVLLISFASYFVRLN